MIRCKATISAKNISNANSRESENSSKILPSQRKRSLDIKTCFSTISTRLSSWVLSMSVFIVMPIDRRLSVIDIAPA